MTMPCLDSTSAANGSCAGAARVGQAAPRFCRACGGRRSKIFFDAPNVPSNSCLLIPSREEALACRRGRIALVGCPSCGFIFNAAFDPRLTEYSPRYEETQGFSQTFNAFQDALAAELVERHHLHGKTVVEIGCGKGEFLARLCELGGSRGIGFDPAFVGGRQRPTAHLQVIRDFYSEKYAHLSGDFICCKMTLEHIPEPCRLLRTIRQALGRRPSAVVFFQVPDVTRILRDCALEDVYHEHCSYFSAGSLGRLFRRCGFEILSLRRVYGDQYLTLEARPAAGGEAAAFDVEDDRQQLQQWAAAFAGGHRQKTGDWRRRLAAWRAAGRPAVLWGSGSKGVAFLTAVGLTPAELPYVVDINPHRQGYYMAGTGQRIVSPAFLREQPPAAVIVMNPVYRQEIGRDLQALGLAPELWTP